MSTHYYIEKAHNENELASILLFFFKRFSKKIKKVTGIFIKKFGKFLYCAMILILANLNLSIATARPIPHHQPAKTEHVRVRDKTPQSQELNIPIKTPNMPVAMVGNPHNLSKNSQTREKMSPKKVIQSTKTARVIKIKTAILGIRAFLFRFTSLVSQETVVYVHHMNPTRITRLVGLAANVIGNLSEALSVKDQIELINRHPVVMFGINIVDMAINYSYQYSNRILHQLAIPLPLAQYMAKAVYTALILERHMDYLNTLPKELQYDALFGHGIYHHADNAAQDKFLNNLVTLSYLVQVVSASEHIKNIGVAVPPFPIKISPQDKWEKLMNENPKNVVRLAEAERHAAKKFHKLEIEPKIIDEILPGRDISENPLENDIINNLLLKTKK